MALTDQVSPEKLGSPESDRQPDTEKIEHLRSLLLGNNYEEAIKNFISESDTERVSKVISEALQERAEKDQSLSGVLSPIIDSAIDESIKQNPKRITNVIFPVMGPAIRKAVSAALSDMVQTLNQVLSNSLSVKSWGWRYQAWRAGKSYGEYLLLKTLKYRVEQVFLIHKNTGLLLSDASNTDMQKQDPELVSSMLAAINDFVSDSFHKPEQLSIDSVRFGEYHLTIVPGPLAVMAAAIKGTPSSEINEQLRTTVETIHSEYLGNLIDFEGDKDDFLTTEPLLKSCLLEKILTKKKSRPWLAYMLLSLLAIMGMWQAYTTYISASQKADIIHTLKQQPGYLIVDQETNGEQLKIVLLRPPASQPAQEIISTLDIGNWDVQIEDKIAPLNVSQYMLPFVRESFNLSPNTKLSLSGNNELIVSGYVEETTYKEMQSSQLLASSFNLVNYQDVTVIPEVTTQQRDLISWETISASIASSKVYFESNTNILMAGEESKLTKLALQINELNHLAGRIGVPEFQILITGFADSRGSKTSNIKISESRAAKINDLLKSKNVDSRLLVGWGAGHIDSNKLSEREQRIVSFQVLHPQLETYTP